MTAVTDVLVVSSSYPADLRDWRGLFIRHQVDALARRDDVRVSVWAPPGDLPANATVHATPGEQAWLAGLMASGGIAHHLRSGGIRAATSPLRLLWSLRRAYHRSTADLYHVNWLQNALVLPADGRPLLATALGTDMRLLGIPGVVGRLRQVFRGRRVALCPNADWMVPPLERAFGDLARVRCVPFGIDPAWFAVERQPFAHPAGTWLCVTRVTAGKLGRLLDWGAAAFGSGRRELHLFGPMQEDIALPGWIHYHGPATPDALCREWFPRARGCITLSQHPEGRPQVLLEAMAAGLPVVASRLPAHADLVRDGDTGLLCGSAAEVEAALDLLDDPDVNRAMGERARRQVARDVGTWDDCAARYAMLYRELRDAGGP